MLLEVCAFTLKSCMIAAQGGADRVELCADPGQGGTTPSFGMITASMEIGLPVFPMIRPRGGNFHYGPEELDVMWRDIRTCRELGCPGIVTGALCADGALDGELMDRIVERSGPMAVTCHKAFDLVPDLSSALERLVQAGCDRVLTSGSHANAMEGAPALRQLVAQAAGRITVMPGGGVRSGNIADLIAITGAREFHSSAVTTDLPGHTADENEVRALVLKLRAVRDAGGNDA